MHIFQHADESIRKKIYLEKVLKKNGQDNFMPLEEGVKRVRKVSELSECTFNAINKFFLTRDFLHSIWNYRSDIN